MNLRSKRVSTILKTMVAVTLISPVLVTVGLCSRAPQILPATPTEVMEYLQNAEANVLKIVHQMVSVPSDQKTSENTMKPWNQLGTDLLVDFTMLTYLTQSNFPSKMDAAKAIQGLQAFLYQSVVQNPDLFRSLMTYVNTSIARVEKLTPYERYEIQCLLESCDGIKASLPQQEQEALAHFKAINGQYEQKPFIYLKSHTPEKSGAQSDLTVLTFNTCFVPGQFPFIYGGVSLPWQKRIAPLAKKIVDSNADIICFQEVHAQEASFALYEALKDHYTHFYAAIGPRLLGFSLETLGLPSGLFVASKYPIENPKFTLFSVSGFPMNYGFFDFVVKSGDKSIGHIYTTHMQGLNYDQFAQIRAAQLNQIMAKMQGDVGTEAKKMPYFLCGDLNIPFGSNEPGLALIQSSFHDDYNKNQASICENNRTCTDYFTNYLLASTKNLGNIDTNFQILDYALLLHSFPSEPEQLISQGYQINTQLIRMNELDNPGQAISDHHALLTTIGAKKL